MKEDKTIHKYIDEAGDPNFFGKGGKEIIGQEGVSKTFSLGMVDVKEEDVAMVEAKILELAKEIETNPYFKSIPSVRKRIKKYGSFIFHAKDDPPEIRKAMYDLLKEVDYSCQIVVGRKVAGRFIRKHNRNENEFYADLLSHLLKDKVKQSLVLNIAQRGSTTNHINLEKAVTKAVERYESRRGKLDCDLSINYNVQDYSRMPILTIVDYSLWAVQRVFERGETRFYDYISDKYPLIVDLYDLDSFNAVDESGKRLWRHYYTRKNQLTSDNKI